MWLFFTLAALITYSNAEIAALTAPRYIQGLEGAQLDGLSFEQHPTVVDRSWSEIGRAHV